MNHPIGEMRYGTITVSASGDRGDEGTFEEPVRKAGASTAKLCEACGAGGDLKYHDLLKN